MADSPQDQDFDPDEDLFSFDEVATDVFAGDDDDLDEIFASFREEEEEALAAAAAGIESTPAVDEAPAPVAAEPTPPVEAAPAAEIPVEEIPAPVAPAPAPAAAAPASAPAPTPPAAPAPVASAPVAQPAPVAAAPAPAPSVAPAAVAAAAPVAPQAQPQPSASPDPVPGAVTLVLPPIALQAVALFKQHRTAALLLIAVTLVNSLVAVVNLGGSDPAPPMKREVTVPGDALGETPTTLPQLTPRDPAPVTIYPDPVALAPIDARNHPGLERAREEILDGRYASARQRIYSLLAIIDRMDPDQREPLEAHAQFLLAESLHLEAVNRMEATR